MTRVQFTLRVAGPGATEHMHLFNEAASIEEFLGWYGEVLTRDGWSLQAYIDRRTGKPTDEPYAAERRRPRRWTMDESQ